MNKLRRFARLLVVVGAASVLGSASARVAAAATVEVDVDEVTMVIGCDLDGCKTMTSHYCVDLTVYPYAWHSNCYPS